ncbi:MAG: bi-domain-containing oxidoreductase [Candidatus Hydrogenedentes bacterium]|nr:bi-domain-containing oxidoreductase [Candidatus Hydrogenedentota bacterium]
MKQVINRRGTIVVEEVAPPPCGAGELRIALRHSLISAGTELRSVETAGQSLAGRAKERPDLVRKVVDRAKQQGVMAAYRAVREKLEEPKPLGYSAAGVVVEVGANVTGFAPGDRVACGGADAAHAEIVSVPQNLVVRLPEGLPDAQGAFATVGSIAMQGVRRAKPEFGETFVVLGLGLIGQLCVQFAKAAGLHVIGFDLAKDRVELAKAFGADAAYDLGSCDAVERVADFTQGRGADGVIVAAGTKSSDPINLAMNLLRERGRVSIVGVVGLEMKWGAFYAKELDIHMSRSYGPGRYDIDYEERGLKYPLSHVRWTQTENMAEVLRLIAEGRVDVERLTSKVFSIDEAPEAYAALQAGAEKPLGVLLKYPGIQPAPPRPVDTQPASRDKRETVKVAVIGCGNFAKLERLPYLQRMREYEIAMLVSHTGAKVQQLAQQYGIERYATDYQEALADPNIDLLIVATPHSLHGQISKDAAKAGKDLIVEKPMAVNAEELEEVYAALRDAGVRYACGFNRRFAPAAIELKKLRDAQSGPCTVVYRANVGLVPPGSWMHAPEEGGGRIVGEACHFYDFCNWLVGAAPLSVSSSAVSYTGDQFVGTDNLSSIVKYADGSTAMVIYSTMGHTGLEKERVEFFAGGKAAVLNDFKALAIHGTAGGWSASAIDKGHGNFMSAIAQAMSAGEDLPIGLEASYQSHRLMFAAMEAARTGAVVGL